MQVRFIKFGESLQTLELPDKGATVADVLRLAGENPQNLNGFRVAVSGEAGEVELDRPVRPEETVVLTPMVKGG